MSTRTLRTALAAASALVIVVAGACGGDDIADRATERLAEAASGGNTDVSIDSDTGEMRVETEDGSVSIGSAELPADWPSDIPMPADYELTSAMESTSAEGLSANVSGTFPGQISQVFDEVGAGFAEAGWKETYKATNSTGDGTASSATFENDQWRVMFTVSDTGDENTFNYTLVPMTE